MAEILEATMLVCFGCSWPISLMKNIKAKTAKTMSLQFILLIIFGYLAGITAKIITHKINYVLVVYLLNLIVVSMNLVIYFVNKRIDNKNSVVAVEGKEMLETSGELNELEETYREMNELSHQNGIVFFGSNSFSKIRFAELASSFNLDENIYNRSVANQNIDEVCHMLNTCVLDLAPQKVFINMGDYDIKNYDLDVNEFIAKYEWMLYTINKNTNADIHVVSILSNSAKAKQINTELKKLAVEHGCKYIDITSTIGVADQALKAFSAMKAFIRTKPLTFWDSMNSVTVS